MENRAIIQESFELDGVSADELEQTDLASLSEARMAVLAERLRSVLVRRLRRKCFVIMPYRKQFDALFEEAIRPAVRESDFTAVRADRLDLAGNAVQVLLQAIHSCDCTIALLTGMNPNVMYELGFAHALGKPAILLARAAPDGRFLDGLPFDILTEYVIGYGDDHAALRERITSVLQQVAGG